MFKDFTKFTRRSQPTTTREGPREPLKLPDINKAKNKVPPTRPKTQAKKLNTASPTDAYRMVLLFSVLHV